MRLMEKRSILLALSRRVFYAFPLVKEIVSVD